MLQIKLTQVNYNILQEFDISSMICMILVHDFGICRLESGNFHMSMSLYKPREELEFGNRTQISHTDGKILKITAIQKTDHLPNRTI